jgi:6-phosphogluconolactonase (cycloisomerase 2 family)
MHRAHRVLLSVFLLAGIGLIGCDATGPPEANDEAAPAAGETRTARPGGAGSAGGPATGAVFTMTNRPSGNAVVAFNRAATGRLSKLDTYPTGGAGGRGVTPSSNPLAFGDEERYLFVANPGSDEVSVFSRRGRSLTRTDVVASGGPRPLSVAVDGNLVYVLNAGREGAAPTIRGFALEDGTLSPIGTAALPDGVKGPPQIGFSPSGDQLVVTDRPSDQIIVYPVQASGQVKAPTVTDVDEGSVPFGFDFTPQGTLLVSEARGAPSGSALSHFQITSDGTLATVVNSAPTTEKAACWVEVTPDGKLAYVTNTASGTVTGFRVQADGAVQRVTENGVAADLGDGSVPLDMTISGSVLYVHEKGDRAITGFRIDPQTGALTKTDGAATGLPASAAGLASF